MAASIGNDLVIANLLSVADAGASASRILPTSMDAFRDARSETHARRVACASRFFQVCVAEHGAEGVVLVREQGPRRLKVDHVNDVRGLPRLARLAIQSVFPLLDWDHGVEFIWVGERMFGDVGRLLVLPAPEHCG